MVDRYVVDARLGKIREYVALLRKIYGQSGEKQFIKDPLVYGNAERYLQLAIQCVLDVSNHIVADMRLNLPSDNKELFEMLARTRSCPRRLRKNLQRWPVSGTFSFMSISRSIVRGYFPC